MQYRRSLAPGGCYFFTVVTNNRKKIFTNDRTVDVLREAFKQIKDKRPFEIDAMVVMPDHLHCIWSLPGNDADYSTRWRLIKTWFTKHCNEGLKNRSKQTVWQKRYWEHQIKDDKDYEQHVDYIHYNPVKHGFVTKPIDWPYSSLKGFVEKGVFPENWGAGYEVIVPDYIGNE